MNRIHICYLTDDEVKEERELKKGYVREYDKGVRDAIGWFEEELDRLVRTRQIDMVHTNLDKIINDARKEIKKEE